MKEWVKWKLLLVGFWRTSFTLFFLVMSGTRAAVWHSRTRSSTLESQQCPTSKLMEQDSEQDTLTHINASVTAELSHLKGHRDFSISSRKHVVRFSCREWKGFAVLSFVVATRRTSVSIMENIIYRQRDFLLFNFNAEAHAPQTTNSRACDATLRSRRIQRQ